MDKRRLGGWWCAVAAFMAALNGCAQPVRVESAGKKTESTADLVARSAGAMSRFWNGDKSSEEQRAADAHETVNAAHGESRPHAPPAAAPAAEPRPRKPDAAPANVAERSEEPLSPRAAAAAVPEVRAPAPAPVAALPPAPAAPASAGVAGFFSGEAVTNVSEEAAKGPSLRISTLALCSRVDGFGRFVRMESARLTGRPVALLVYTQVDGFAYRTLGGEAAASGVDEGRTQWVVDLAQTVAVYRLSAAGDGKVPDEQVLYVPEQPCRDVAVGKRRDHFLVQRIELSPWVVAGKYAVKVTVRDKATGVVDERMTEIVLR